MQRDEFVEVASALIERALLQARGMMDHMPPPEPSAIARQIADLLPERAFGPSEDVSS